MIPLSVRICVTSLYRYTIFSRLKRQSWVLFSATKYMGDDRSVFEEAVSTQEAGLYTCQISHDEIVTLPLPVESAMHVSIVGDESMPQWRFTGEGPTFTVAVHAYLNLGYVTVPGGQVSTMRGGEVSIDHVQLQGTQLHVAGSMAVSNSQLVDVQIVTESSAVVTMDTVTISGTGVEPQPLVLGCPVTINGGEIRNTELQVAPDGVLILIGTSIHAEGMVVSVATGGSFTVSTSQLIHSGAAAAPVSAGNPSCWSGEFTAVRCCDQASGPTGDDSCWSGTFDFAFCCPPAPTAAPTQDSVTDPFPCNGANMACVGQHAGSVMIAGPASINTAAPLVCADETAGSCLSGYVDMPSCLADITRGMASCFVYLQRDTAALGTVMAAAGQYFEVHGGQGPLQLQADWAVAASASVILADLWLVGGGGSGGSQLSVDSSGQLMLRGIQLQGGVVSFSGAVSLSDCILAGSQLLGSGAASSLALSGGTVTGSTASLGSGIGTVTGSVVLTNSRLSVGAGGGGGSLSVSGAELQSDGSSVPLTVESGGAAIVTGTVFRSTAGDITVASVAEGGSLTVGGSRLVGADGSADPFPCDGTLPDCAGGHAGSVVVEGMATVTLASPLVCDVETGECLADVCLGRGDVCADAHGDMHTDAPGLAWPAASTCIDGTCICTSGADQDMEAVSLWVANGCGYHNYDASQCVDPLSICLAGDASAAVGEQKCATGPAPCLASCGEDGCSKTLMIGYVSGGPVVLTIDCGAVELCRILNRLEMNGPATNVLLRGLLFSNLRYDGAGGALKLDGSATLSLVGVTVQGCAAGGNGGGIFVDASTNANFMSSSFANNAADYRGGGIYVCSPDTLRGYTAQINLQITTFRDNTGDGAAINWGGHSPQSYTNDEANAAFGGGTGRRQLAMKSKSASSLPIKGDKKTL